MTIGKTVKALSPAKINLGLDIAERLPNGYHVVRMIMQTLDLCDEVTVCIFSEAEGSGRITLACPGTDLPADGRNLAFRAVELLLDEFGDRLPGDCGIGITIDKRIPVAAGLAGGSGNAAAVLAAVNKLCVLGLSEQELCARGVKLGADVPFCLMQGTCLAEGIGEKLTRLPDLTGGCVLLVKPRTGVSTKWAYETWDTAEEKYHPDIDGMAQLIRESAARGRAKEEGLVSLAPLLGNSFEPVIFGRYPAVEQIRNDMLRLGAAGALMSGSGPTVFGIFPDDETMERAAGEMRRLHPDAFTAQTHVTGPLCLLN